MAIDDTVQAARVVQALSGGQRGTWWRDAKRHDARVALLQARGMVPLRKGVDAKLWVELLQAGGVAVDTTKPVPAAATAQSSTGAELSYWAARWATWAMEDYLRAHGHPHTPEDRLRFVEFLKLGEEAVAAMRTVRALRVDDPPWEE